MIDRSLLPRLALVLPVSALLLVGAVSAHAQVDVPSFCSAYPQIPGAGDWQSVKVVRSNGRLTYPADGNQNRIADFSYAGYKYGQVNLPNVPEVSRISATSGDQTARIQAALDAVAARTPDASGIRGALVLNAGTYQINGTVRVNASGVVLRGVGDSSTGTVLRIVGDTPHQRSGVVLGTGSSTWTEGTKTNITTQFVQVGAMSFDVASTAGYAVGDAIIVRHPSTQAWINAVDGGGMTNSADWAPGSTDILYWRRIRAISGTTVTLDAPVFNHLNRGLAQSTIAKATASYVTESGLEDLRVDIATAGGEDENHAWNAINVNGAQDSWVKNITGLHFGYAGVRVDNAVRITIVDSEANDPIGIRTGGRFYNFAVNNKSQLVLFTRCRLGPDSRHGLVSNGESTVSGVVFHRCTVTGGHDMEAGHRHWTQGMLYDNVVENGSGTVRMINRGDWGTSHGWGSVHSVSWRFNKASLIQQPPTGQNYGITDIGSFSTSYPWPGPTGFQESKTGKLIPESLYEAQICERLESTGPTPTPTPTGSPTPTPTPTSTSMPTPTPTPTVPGAFIEITPAGSAVTASTHDGNLPANTVDDNLGTRWSANGDGQWVKYDLGTVRTVAYVSIAVYNGNARQNRFDLQVSSDNTNWATVIPNGLTSGTTTLEQDHDFADVSARYVRYFGHGATTSTFNSVTEVSIFAPSNPTATPTPTSTPTPTPTPTPSATPTPTSTPGGYVEVTPGGGGVTASTSDVNVPANTVDNNLGTRWSGNGDGAWLQLDLGSTRTIGYVNVAVYNGNSRQNTFDLQVSNGGGTWTTVWSGTNTGTTTAEETYDFTDIAARYVRYLGHGSTATTFNSVTEVSVFAAP